MRFARRTPTSSRIAWVLAALVAAVVPGSAFAQPGCPLFSHFTTTPLDPHDDQPTSVTVYGCLPCGEVVSSSIVGPTQVEVMLRHTESCTDTASVWSASFDFGVLAAGSHNLIVTVRDEATPQVGQLYGMWFTVWGDPGAPPPPPPPLPPAPSGELFTGITTVPSPASTARPTVLVVQGNYPFWCGFVSTAEVLAPDHVALTVRQYIDCSTESPNFQADSTWSQAFNLGILSAGTHDVRISIRKAVGEDSLKVEDFDASFAVVDSGAPSPPPPPPPIDSLLAPQPNPFADRTEIGMIANDDTEVEVAIFDVRGRMVRSIYRGPIAAGTRTYGWDGRSENGARAIAGVYFYRVVQPGRVWARRVVLLPGR